MTCSPNEYTFSILFKICAQLTDQQSIEFGKNILEQMPNKYQDNTIILNSALHMLMQHKQVLLGEELFSRMNKDTISYGVMMSGKNSFARLFSDSV
jgi:hypothetical protein